MLFSKFCESMLVGTEMLEMTRCVSVRKFVVLCSMLVDARPKPTWAGGCFVSAVARVGGESLQSKL